MLFAFASAATGHPVAGVVAVGLDREVPRIGDTLQATCRVVAELGALVARIGRQRNLVCPVVLRAGDETQRLGGRSPASRPIGAEARHVPQRIGQLRQVARRVVGELRGVGERVGHPFQLPARGVGVARRLVERIGRRQQGAPGRVVSELPRLRLIRSVQARNRGRPVPDRIVGVARHPVERIGLLRDIALRVVLEFPGAVQGVATFRHPVRRVHLRPRALALRVGFAGRHPARVELG